MENEIKINTIGQLLDYVETEEKANELIYYITNLQEENKRLKEQAKKDNHILGCNFAQKNKYKSRNEKAKSLTNRTIEIIKQQPSENDEWILERLNGINYCLGGDEEC